MTTRPPTPRREFLQAAIPGGYVNLRCRCCGLVVRFVRGDDRAMRAHKDEHVCDRAVGGDAA